MSEELDALECESLELHETAEKLMAETEEIATSEKGKYQDNIQLCCYALLSLNVGVKNVEVIQSVLYNTGERSVGRLPS